eukprot:scaffold1197_cov65-Phaeocystis_antarctica.AAC.3
MKASLPLGGLGMPDCSRASLMFTLRSCPGSRASKPRKSLMYSFLPRLLTCSRSYVEVDLQMHFLPYKALTFSVHWCAPHSTQSPPVNPPPVGCPTGVAKERGFVFRAGFKAGAGAGAGFGGFSFC